MRDARGERVVNSEPKMKDGYREETASSARASLTGFRMRTCTSSVVVVVVHIVSLAKLLSGVAF